MNKIVALCAVALFAFVSTTSAQARPKHHKRVVQQAIIVCDARLCHDARRQASSTRRIVADVQYEGRVVGGRPAGCPHAYCGCGVSLKVFGRIIPELNLAANWLRKFPRTSPAAGMVAARSGHVFYIEQVIDAHTVVAYDPNSGGHKTRVHTVSLRGFRVVDPHGAKIASR